MRPTILILLAVLLLATPATAANIIIVNNDGPGEGFNDLTPATPVGGNNGTTVGEQRLNAFQHAADIWGAILPSAVTIRVRSQFNVQFCDATGAVLGSAGPIEVFSDFAGAEFAGTWYHVALANRIAGVDLAPTTDDISATFNSALNGDPGCLGGRGWYYGFDGNEGSDVELLPVLLHEMGHGLGFSELVNQSTGEWFVGQPDVYSNFLYDETVELTWIQMNNAQRVASSINTGNLVWNGFAANFAAPSFLGPSPVVDVSSPPAIADPITTVGLASFGPALTETPISGEIILVDDGTGLPSEGCSPLINGGEIGGNIALIDRGNCAFTTKALNAENAGAIAVIIVNNVAGGVINMGGTDPGLSIPSVMIEQSAGTDIKDQLTLGETVNASLVLDPSVLAGTSPTTGLLRVYAPNPVEGGSSISHWDVTANPSLLMEPAITPGLSDEVDLTRYHFEDIGWFNPRVTDTPNMPMARTQLKGNVPNPFNPSTTISFELARSEDVRLAIYDTAGRLVKRLLSERREAGPHSVQWQGRDEAGDEVASGVYFYRFEAGGYQQTERMVLLK